MKRVSRRTLLTAGSVGALTLTGCLDADTAEEGDPPGDDTDGSGDEDVTYDVFQLGPSLSRPDWAAGDAETVGAVTLLESERKVRTIATVDEVDELEAWLEDTDFDESAVLLVETVGPNTCYDELEVSDVGVSPVSVGDESDAVAAITGTATAVDTSDETTVCGEAITYPSALVRVTGDDLPPMAAFEITNGWGDTGDVDTIGGAVDPDALPGYVRPPTDPQTVPDALDCEDDEFRRHWSPDDDVAWGEVRDEDGGPALAMRVQNPQYDGDDVTRALKFERGDEVRVSMRNVSDEQVYTGNGNKYSLEVLTADGWTDVRGTTDDFGFEYTDEALGHAPGDGFEWTFELTADGVVGDHANADRLEVCPDLPAGRYRFAFWGALGDASLAVAFDFVG